MVYEIKLLIAASIVGLLMIWLARPAFRELLPGFQYRDTWAVVALATVLAFMSHFIWLYFIAVAATALIAAKIFGGDYKAKIAAFILLSVVFPPLSSSLGGIGDINQLFAIDHAKLMSIILFGPAAVKLLFRKRVDKKNPFFAVDLFLVLYEALSLVLLLQSISYTAVARFLFECTVETFLPYYVFTRGLKSVDDIKFVMTRLMVGFVFIAGVAVVEELTQRSFYGPLQYIYGTTWQLTRVMLRAGLLRVQATTPQPIVLAFFMVIAIGTWTWLAGRNWKRMGTFFVFALLLVAMISTWSRGPWLGAGLLAVSMFAMSRMSWKAYGWTLGVLTVVAIAAKAAGMDEFAYTFLKTLFGSSEEDFGTIQYRREILDATLALIRQSPAFGVTNYGAYLQGFRQGEGIVDIVNTYVLIALNSGVVGLILYLAPSVIVISRLLKQLNSPPDGRSHDLFVVAFLSTILAILFILFTASTIGTMRYMILFLLGVPLAYAQIRTSRSKESPAAAPAINPVLAGSP